MYLDYYILENLLINYIIINCTTYITKIYTKKFKQICGAIIGTIYSVMYIYKDLEIFFTLPSKFIFFIVIVLISFNVNLCLWAISSISVISCPSTLHIIPFSRGHGATATKSLK